MVTAHSDAGKPARRSLDRLQVAFDDEHAVANAGLVLTGTLAQRLDIEGLGDQIISLGERPGAFRPGRKIMSLVHSIVAGGDCIEDADVLRTGSAAQVLGHRVMAPSTAQKRRKSVSSSFIDPPSGSHRAPAEDRLTTLRLMAC